MDTASVTDVLIWIFVAFVAVLILAMIFIEP